MEKYRRTWFSARSWTEKEFGIKDEMANLSKKRTTQQIRHELVNTPPPIPIRNISLEPGSGLFLKMRKFDQLSGSRFISYFFRLHFWSSLDWIKNNTVLGPFFLSGPWTVFLIAIRSLDLVFKRIRSLDRFFSNPVLGPDLL